MSRLAAKFWRDREGNLVVPFAIAVPALVIAAVAGIDITTTIKARGRLQDAADAAVLALAADARLNTALDSAAATNQAKRQIQSQLQVPDSDLTITVVTTDAKQFTIDARQALKSITGKLIGSPFDATAVRSIARLSGAAKICVVTLNTTAYRSLKVEKNGLVQGGGCAIIANSNNTESLYVQASSSASISASRVVTAGNASGKPTTPPAINRMTPIPDPMQSFLPQEPSEPDCNNAQDKGGAVVLTGPYNLPKGVYCQPVQVKSGAVVNLEPGAYHFKNRLDLKEGSSFSGDGVTLYFYGPNGGVRMSEDAAVSLSGAAAQVGNVANVEKTLPGVLMWQHSSMRQAGKNGGNRFEFNTTKITRLTGIIYLPDYTLSVTPDDAYGVNGTVAQSSPWTALIVNNLAVSNSARVILNTNYGGAPNVPAPDSLKSNAYIAQPVLSN